MLVSKSSSTGIVGPAATAPTVQQVAPSTTARLRWGPLVSVRLLPAVVTLVAIALVTRVIAAVGVERVLVAQRGDGFIGPDERAYDRLAWLQAQAWHGIGPGVHPLDLYLVNAYVKFEAAVYYFFGHHPFAMKAMNCLLGALMVGFIFLIARHYFGQPAGYLAGIAAAFFPSTFLWSITTLKDTMYLATAAFVLWLFSLLLANGNWRLIPAILAPLFLIGGIRLYIQAMIAVILVGTLIVQRRSGLPQKWALTTGLACGIAVVFLFSGGPVLFGVTPDLVNRQRYCAAVGAESEFVTETAQQAEEACAAPTKLDEEETVLHSQRDLIAWLPTGMTYALAAPFPWMAERRVEQLTIPEMLAWYVALALAVIGLARYWRNWRQFAHLLGYIGGILLLLALTQGNLGTLVRHRGMIIPFVLILSGAGAAWLWSRYAEKRLVSADAPTADVHAAPKLHVEPSDLASRG